MRKTSTHTLTLTALLTALLCIAGPLTLPLGPVPLSLTSALLMLTALLADPLRALICCALYLLMGAAGLPVFAGFAGGVGQLAGPTGGYLLGYLPLTAISGWVCQRTQSKVIRAMGFLLGTAALYALGTAWYCLHAGVPASSALTVCVLPFLPLDAAKIALVTTIGASMKARLRASGLLR